jgi:hypothetical protein
MMSLDPEGQAPVGCGGLAMGDMHTAVWGSLAASLGMSAAELDEAMAGGVSLLELAQARGLAPEQLAEEMLAAMETALNEQIARGNLTSEQASSLLQAARTHMTPEHLTAMGSMAEHMSGWSGSFDMNAMHESMHGPGNGFGMGSMHGGMGGQGEPGGGSCHEDEAGETRYPVRSMMRMML